MVNWMDVNAILLLMTDFLVLISYCIDILQIGLYNCHVQDVLQELKGSIETNEQQQDHIALQQL